MGTQPPYRVEGSDTVIELKDLPAMDSGAPLPEIAASEDALTLSYRNSRNATTSKTIVRFTRAIAHYFGPPNDEALQGHPLYGRGLSFYAAHEVGNSSWIRKLEEMNRVHSRHSAQQFLTYRHFIFTFHDSTFECIATGYQVEANHGAA